MNKIIGFLCIYLFCLNFISAQNISLAFKSGRLFPSAKFEWNRNVQNKSNTKTTPIFAISGEGKFFKNIYLGVEVGVSSYKSFINIKYFDEGGQNGLPLIDKQVTYSGWFQQEQYYFSFSPQIKFGKNNWLSLGGGFGTYNNYINRFHNGTQSVKASSFVSNTLLDGHNLYMPNTVLGGYFNVSLNPKINNHIGFLLEVRYIINSPSEGQITKVTPSLHYNSFSVLTGLSFNL